MICNSKGHVFAVLFLYLKPHLKPTQSLLTQKQLQYSISNPGRGDLEWFNIRPEWSVSKYLLQHIVVAASL